MSPKPLEYRKAKSKVVREPELVRIISAPTLPAIPDPKDSALASRESLKIMGRRFDRATPFYVVRMAGVTLESIISDCLMGMKAEGVYTTHQCEELKNYARCKVNGTEVAREHWANFKPVAGSHIEIYRAVAGGGGGGKNPLGVILGVVAMIGSIFVAPMLGPILAASTGLFSVATWTAITGLGFSMIGVMGSLLFPASTPSLSVAVADNGKTSQTYSISGAQNSVNPYGYVPFVMGKHRLTPPLGAKSWTEWQGDEQYFNMLVVWGHPDMEVSDFRIGDTPLSAYSDVTHEFHQSCTGTGLIYFAKSTNELDVSAVVKNSDGWVTRTIGEAEDIIWDFAFTRGLVSIDKNTGNYNDRSVSFEVQYRQEGTETWYSAGNNSSYTWTGKKLDLVVKSVSQNGLTRGRYETRVRRTTADTSSQYIYDECTWLTVRGRINREAFNSPIPLCVSEIHIKATDQLSGYISNLSALCSMKIEDYDPRTKRWKVKETRNPASIFRYLLTSNQALRRPYTEAKLDMDSIVEAWEWCNERGYTYDYVGDAEENVWTRLTEVLSSARCAIDYMDGKWGIIIDKPNKEPVQMFTPRNSWGIRVDRTFYEAPHALLVTWIRAEDDYEQTQNFVFADGYDKSNATNIIEWEYPGVTEWEQLYKAARYHLAKLLHRQVTVSFSTDWEWLKVRRGDLVGLASDVLMNVFGTARIVALLFSVSMEDGSIQEILVYDNADIPVDEEGQSLAPIGCLLDDTIVFSEPGDYGIAIRDESARLFIYQIFSELNKETDLLRFVNTLTPAQTPPIGALVSVSVLGSEFAEYLVASITPGENLTADISLIPYAIKEIEASADGTIPPWEPPIYLPNISGDTLPVPIILYLKSDESMLIRGQGGECLPRLGVWWRADIAQDSNIYVQAAATPVDGGVSLTSTAELTEEYLTIQNVTESVYYDVKVRFVARDGRAGKWSSAVRHKVIGRTTPPPAPAAVYLDGYVLKIIQQETPLDLVGHEVWMGFDEDDPFSYALKISTPYVTNQQFDLTAYAGRARQVFVRTIDEIGLTSDPVRLVIDLGEAMPSNILFQISERDDNNWSGTLEGGYIYTDNLFSATKTALWQQENSSRLWQQTNNASLWANGVAEILVYTWTVEIPSEYSGARVFIQPDIVVGSIRSIEMRIFRSPDLWEQDNTSSLWPMDDGDNLWPQIMVDEWQVFSNDYQTPGGETLEFRITMSPKSQAQIADILTILDVDDKEWAVENFYVSEGGDYIPIPDSYFRAITNVVFGLQYVEGLSAIVVKRITENTLPKDENGYLIRGPLIRAYNADNTPGSANVDIRMKGY